MAVNLPSGEADIRPLTPQAITQLLGGLDMQFVEGEQLPDAAAVSEGEGVDYGWTLLLAVLGLTAMECVLAMRFGHGGNA